MSEAAPPLSADAAIIGAGPVGLFAAFQLGLFGFKCMIVDARNGAGGQCMEYYADKPIYDVPAWPVITGEELVDRLLEQSAPFRPTMIFNTVATALQKDADGRFLLGLGSGASVVASTVIIACGWGVIGNASSASLSMEDWGVNFQPEGIPIEPSTFETGIRGVFAIGDICLYPGKLRLILSGFHEAAIATQAIRKLMDPSAKAVVHYSSTSTELQKNLGVSKSA